MTIEEFDQQLKLIKHVVAQMQEGVHYGVIPGTRDKSLWEPGAEYLRGAFKISWSYELTKQTEDFETGDFRYEFRCFTVPPTQPAEWAASAWSKERRFWCRRECLRDCAQDHPPAMEKAMLPHNVKDRALKRGFVALMRNVTGTSGWFKMALDAAGDGQPAPARAPRKSPASSPDIHPEPESVPQKAEASSARRFHTVTEFWDATEKAGWTREQVAEVLGSSIGGWLNDRSKEWGRFATWDDAYDTLVGELGIEV